MYLSGASVPNIPHKKFEMRASETLVISLDILFRGSAKVSDVLISSKKITEQLNAKLRCWSYNQEL